MFRSRGAPYRLELKMESDAVEADGYVENLPSRVMENVVREIDKAGAWAAVGNELVSRLGDKVISDGCDSSEKVLNHMKKLNFQVKHLQLILESCQIYAALRVINTNDPAKILEPVKDTTYLVSLDSKIILVVEVSGSPFPELQWYLNNSPLVGQTSLVLELKHFSMKDVGEYTCRIQQRLQPELTSPKYILKVKETLPSITTDLQDVLVGPMENLTLSFEVTGYPKPHCFRWFKNGNYMSQTEMPQLRIQGADVHNSGEYFCTVLNTAGSCKTRTAVVKVKDPVMCSEKPEIIEQPKTSEVYYTDDRLYLTCVARCSGDVKFVCFLNDQELKGNNDVHIITSSSSSVKKHCCTLMYCLTKEQKEKQNLKQLRFKFQISPVNGDCGLLLSDEVKVQVKTRNVEKPLTARNKWALVMGNSMYQEMSPLPGSSNDIHTIKKNFIELGFRVLMLSNLNRSAIQNVVKKFATFVQEGDYVSLFYAGHGVHNEGKDYIIPVDAKVNHVSRPQNVSLDEQHISFNDCISQVWITNILQEHKPALIFSIYDTCRLIKPKFEGYESPSSQDFQTALKNSFTLFATSENYEAYEMEDVDTSLLVDALQSLITHKMPVQTLSVKVLEKFHLLGVGEDIQVPKCSGDLALPRSLADPSQPHQGDEAESGVLKKWEEAGSGRGRIQHSIPVDDTKVEASIYWNIEPRKDGVTWVISNCLDLSVDLTVADSSDTHQMEVLIKLRTEKELLQKSKKVKLKSSVCEVFSVPHLQDLEKRLQVQLFITYKGHLYKGELHFESPAISQVFYRGNYIG